MDIVFENFTEKYIDEAVRLAKAEWEAECTHCPDLPCFKFEERLKQILWWLSNQNFGGKAAFCDGKLLGYLLFAGPWDGMFGNVKGVFSPLGGSAFSYEYENRDKLASMLFAAVAQELVAEGIFSCALSRYAHDEVVAKSFVLNGFGIRCMDAVRSVEALAKQNCTAVEQISAATEENYAGMSSLSGFVEHIRESTEELNALVQE